MKNISYVDQQYRRRAGEHLIRLQQKQISQKSYQKHCENIAKRPGCHSGNVNKQNMLHATLSLLAMLSLVQNNSASLARNNTNVERLSLNKNIKLPNDTYNKDLAEQTVSSPKEMILSWHMNAKNRTPVSAKNTTAKNTHHLQDRLNDTRALRDSLNVSQAAFLPVEEEKQGASFRTHRHVMPPVKKTTPATVVDDVKIAKLYDFSCINNEDGDTFPQILRQISHSLSQPVTQLTIESMNVDSWRKGKGCPDKGDVERVSKITNLIDAVISQVVDILPYSKPITITQSIVAPLLEKAADDLQGQQPISEEQELSLLQEIIQQARMTIPTINHVAPHSLSSKSAGQDKSPALIVPSFHLQNGINHIDVEVKGTVCRAPVSYTKGNIYATVSRGHKGEKNRYRVYFNYVSRKWNMMGNGRFNRFSKKEQRLAHRFSLPPDFIYKHQNGNIPATYIVPNPYSSSAERLRAIELFGQLVPYRYRSDTKQLLIYNAAQSHGPTYEVVIARNQWHLKLPEDKKVKFSMLYSPEYSRTLKVDMIREVNGQKIYAQINTDAGFLWGEKFSLNKNGHLELLAPKKGQDRYYKNTIGNSLLSGKEGNVKNEKKHQVDNDDVIYYQRDSGCFRVKRGAFLGHMCKKKDNGESYPLTQQIDLSRYPVIAEGSIGVVYDYQPGTVIKKYKGKFDERHKSRLLAAKNNTKGFNLFYGDDSAKLYITSNYNGTGSVFVKLKKINGNALDSIKNINDREVLNSLMDAIDNTSPAETLSKKLQQLGVVHNDINKGNVIYDVETGFHIIDFDSANYLPDGETVSDYRTESMKNAFTYVFNEVRRDIQYKLTKLNESP